MSDAYSWVQWDYTAAAGPSSLYTLTANLTTLAAPTGNLADVQSYGFQILPNEGSVVSVSITDLKIY
jgi:hypothetical protein